jgi:hypothetical protein
VVERDEGTGDSSYDKIVENGSYADMTFGVRAFHSNMSDFNDPSYFTFQFTQTTNTYNSFTNKYSTSVQYLESQSCDQHPLFIIDPVTGINNVQQDTE